MESLTGVGERLAIARAACRLNKFQVAKALGVHASTVTRWENGERHPRRADLETLASIYQVAADWLLEGSREDAPEAAQERQMRARAALEIVRSAVANVGAPALRRRPLVVEFSDPRHQIGEYSIPETEESRLLESISGRVRQILLAQHRLPVIKEVPQEVIRGIRDGFVVPTPWLIYELAKNLNVYADWLLRGEPSGDQSSQGE
jgi:transcriptional regulator with XRE-family HTH domain